MSVPHLSTHGEVRRLEKGAMTEQWFVLGTCDGEGTFEVSAR